MNRGDLPPADGYGAQHFDVPTRFYLTHREDIERWAALRKNASDAIHRWHLDLQDELIDVADRIGLSVGRFRTGANYRCWLIHDPGGAVGADKAPVAAIGIRWHRTNPVVDEPKLTTRVGVRISDRQIRERFLGLDGGLRPIRDSHGFKSDTMWPAYRPLLTDGSWWSDLDTYRQQLLVGLSQTVELFGPPIQQLDDRS